MFKWERLYCIVMLTSLRCKYTSCFASTVTNSPQQRGVADGILSLDICSMVQEETNDHIVVVKSRWSKRRALQVVPSVYITVRGFY